MIASLYQSGSSASVPVGGIVASKNSPCKHLAPSRAAREIGYGYNSTSRAFQSTTRLIYSMFRHTMAYSTGPWHSHRYRRGTSMGDGGGVMDPSKLLDDEPGLASAEAM